MNGHGMVKALSFLSLLMLLAVPLAYYFGMVALPLCKTLLMVATIIWFSSAVFWIGKTKDSDE